MWAKDNINDIEILLNALNSLDSKDYKIQRVKTKISDKDYPKQLIIN